MTISGEQRRFIVDRFFAGIVVLTPSALTAINISFSETRQQSEELTGAVSGGQL